MSTKIEVNAMAMPGPLPVVKTLKALKQLDGEGTVVTSVDNETAVKNISKMARRRVARPRSRRFLTPSGT